MKIVVFWKKPICVFQFQPLKEHWKVFINIQASPTKSETPLLEFPFEEGLQENNSEYSCSHQEHGGSMIDIDIFDEVAWTYLLGTVCEVVPIVMEDRLIAELPIAEC